MTTHLELDADSVTAATPPEEQATALFSDVNERQVKRELAEAMLSANQSFSVAGFLLAVAFGGVFWWETGRPIVIAWIVIMNLSQLIRLRHLRIYLNQPLAERDPVRTSNQACIGIALTSTGWGLAPLLFLPKDDVGLVALSMIVLMGMVTGGLASVAPVRRAMFCLVIPALSGLAIALFSNPTIINVFLAFCTLAYIGMTLRFGTQQTRLLELAIRTRLEREALAARLAEQIRVVEQASLEKTRFFASASHDLRQPLHSIGMIGTALTNGLSAGPNRDLVDSLMQCVNALETSFTAMLDVSKLDAGVIEPAPQPTCVADVFRSLESVFRTQADRKGLALRFAPGGRWVLADPALLERALANLIHNALTFTEQGGVSVVARRRQGQVSIEVRDTGVGIAPADLNRIFEEFFQVGNPERDRSRGLGMGLAIVRRLARLMNMPMSVSSSLQRGSTFKLLLPVASPQTPNSLGRTEIPKGPQVDLTKLSLLIIDDEQAVRLSMSSALSHYFGHIECADGLIQALEISERLEDTPKRIDFIVSDLRLRDREDGLEVVPIVRSRLGRAVPALLVTGDTAPERVIQARNSGIGVLYKPLKLPTLIEAVQQALSSKP